MEWREGKEKFERGYIGDDQLLRGTQECDIFFKGTQVKASYIFHMSMFVLESESMFPYG
jgi:hypothetical protein